MAYLPKQIVERAVKVRVRKDRNGADHTDYEAYLGVDPFTHKPVRLTRTDRDGLAKAIRDFYERHRAGGDAAVRLTANQALDAKTALDILASSGKTETLTELARMFVDGRTRAVVTHDKRVADAYEEYLAAKPDGVNKEKTRSTVGRWASEMCDKNLRSVTAKDIYEYLERHFSKHAPKTYNSHLQYIHTFLNWCCKDERGYLAANPAKSLAYKEEPWEEPEYMKPADVEKLFRLLEAEKDKRPELLAYAVANFMCGSRAAEVVRMGELDDAAKINLEDETIRIAKGKGFQRGRRPRAFHINPTALAWMKSFDFCAALKRVTKETQKEIYCLARANGVPVFQNCGRHTFITYHVAAYGDPAKTQAMVGTSEKMRADNYCGLASKADGEAYFRIMPSA